MTNKIEISRTLADRLTRAYPAEITDQETMQAMRIEALAALDELRALLAAPAVERQEPVGFRYRAHGGHWEWMDESPFADGREHYKLGGEELQPLYISPPAPVAVVLPSKQEISSLVWNEVLKAEAIPGVSCFNAAEFAVDAVISLIKELNP